MNLKYSECKCTDKGLMYIEFKLGDQVLKWFPKWSEIFCLMDNALLHEEWVNDGNWRTQFQIMCCEVLVKSLIYGAKGYSPELISKAQTMFKDIRAVL